MNTKKDILQFFVNRNYEYLKELEGVHIGSAHKSKDEVMQFVFKKSMEMIAFTNYFNWCVDYLSDNCTMQQFIDWQLDCLSDKSISFDTKQFIKKFLAEFQPQFNL